MKYDTKDLKQIAKYCKGEPCELTETQRAKLDRLSFALEWHQKYKNSQEILENLMIKFGVCEQTARNDIYYFSIVALPNHRELEILNISNTMKKCMEIYEKAGKWDKLRETAKDYSKHLAQHPDKSKEEQKQLPAVIMAQFNLELLPNFAKLSEAQIKERTKMYLTNTDQQEQSEGEFEIIQE